MEVDPNQPAAQTAAGWYARLRASDCSAADRAEFAAWRSVPGNAAAYAAVERLAQSVDRALATGPRLFPQARRAVGSANAMPAADQVPARWRRLLPGIAASTALLLGAAAWIATATSRSGTPFALLANDGTDEQRHRLDDGSIVWLDAGTRMVVRFGGRERAVELSHGRALFEVAADASRVFTVSAGGSRTVARGTRFQVERSTGLVSITPADGALAVSGAGPAGRSWEAQLSPGEQLRWTGAGATASKHRVDVARTTSWSGRVALREAPVQQAAVQGDRDGLRSAGMAESAFGAMVYGVGYVARHVRDREQAAAAYDDGLPLWADINDG